MVGTVIVSAVEACQRVLPEEICPYPPSRMTVAGQRGMGGPHLDDRRSFAVGEQVVEREVHGLLRAHHQESFVVALRVAAGDSNQQRILDRKEIREVVKEVDVGCLELGRNWNG